jgi:hypothetical protein
VRASVAVFRGDYMSRLLKFYNKAIGVGAMKGVGVSWSLQMKAQRTRLTVRQQPPPTGDYST